MRRVVGVMTVTEGVMLMVMEPSPFSPPAALFVMLQAAVSAPDEPKLTSPTIAA
jgi:hypothetical protein